MLRQLPEALEPPLRLAIAIGGAAPELAIDAVEDPIADILRLPDIHLKGETADEGGEGLKALEQSEPGGVGAESMGHTSSRCPKA